MTKQTTTVLLFGDTHIGSSAGLCTPTVKREDGGAYRASRLQRALWESWLDFCNRDYPGRVIAIHHGDLCELDIKKRTTEVITENRADIFVACINAITPMIERAEKMVFIRGTPSHVGKDQWMEELVAKDCDNTVWEECKINEMGEKEGKASFINFVASIDGVRFDCAHHTTMGRLWWTKANSANKLAAKAETFYGLDLVQPVPDIVSRAHNHKWSDSGENFRSWAVHLPCWQLPTSYGKSLDNGLPDWGGVAVVIEDGKIVRHEKISYELQKARRVWALKI